MVEENHHVPAMQLWAYTNGATTLNDQHFEHLLMCVECQELVGEFVDVLNEIAAAHLGKAA